MRFARTLTITDDDGRIIQTLDLDSAESQLILALAHKIEHLSGAHTHEQADEEGELRGGDPSGELPAESGVPQGVPAETPGSDRQG